MASTYPDGAELIRYLYGAGMIDSATDPTGIYADSVIDYDRAITAAANIWERDIRRKFLAATFTREYDPPTNARPHARLWVGDFLSVSAITYADTAIASTDYLLGPTNALDLGLPYQYIDFFRRWQAPVTWANRRTLVITGSFGYTSDIPEEVTEAILASAASRLYVQFSSANTGGGATVQSEGDLHEEFDKNPGANLQQRFRDLYMEQIGLYRCWTSGMGQGW